MSRPSWDEYFLGIAEKVSERSTCTRRKTGAVIVINKRILTTGYNGAPRRLAHCTKENCLRTAMDIPSGERLDVCRGVHAEMNALVQAAAHGVPVHGGILYCTNSPCLMCTKALINAGIMHFIVADEYRDKLADEMRKDAGISIVVLHAYGRE